MSSSRLATAPSPASSRVSVRKTASGTSMKSHPPVSDMVNNALLGIKARGGSSMTAIKKYIADNYRVDGDKMKPYIKRYVKTALENGKLVQTKGQGAAGSFRLGAKTLHQMTTSKKSSKTAKPKTTKLKAKKASPKKVKKSARKGKPKKLQKPSGKRASLTKTKGARSSAVKKRKPTKPKKATTKKMTKKAGRR